MVNPDTLVILAKETGTGSFSWLQVIVTIILQTLLLGILIEFLRRKFQKEIESMRNEFTIVQTTYSKNYSIVMDYYSSFIKYYRLCQEVVDADEIRFSDGTSRSTREIYWSNVDQCVHEINKMEAKVELILPEQVKRFERESISAFNGFKNVVRSFERPIDKPRKELIHAFTKIDDCKKDLAKELKLYLRTEKLYPKIGD
jgi:hypothetical protein